MNILFLARTKHGGGGGGGEGEREKQKFFKL
jgi:hypothetical protein